MNDRLQAPFPYFGGKASAAALVWQALGDVPSCVEPFVGSAAVLLARPADHRPVRETVNDADGFISNVWRALRESPAEVAAWADYPVCERDLEARHHWLVTEGARRLAAIAGDPEAYDAQVAGWWIWGACAWIASGWCSGAGPWRWTGSAWECAAGLGINRKLPNLGDGGQGEAIAAWFAALSARLRRVVVTCGDWSRCVASDSALGLTHRASVGVFLDPPYGGDRTMNLYTHDCAEVYRAVLEWCREHGRDGRKRIVLAGYAGDGNELLTGLGWRECSAIPKRGGAGYGNRTGAEGNGANRQRERLWLSPACHALRQAELFTGVA